MVDTAIFSIFHRAPPPSPSPPPETAAPPAVPPPPAPAPEPAVVPPPEPAPEPVVAEPAPEPAVVYSPPPQPVEDPQTEVAAEPPAQHEPVEAEPIEADRVAPQPAAPEHTERDIGGPLGAEPEPAALDPVLPLPLAPEPEEPDHAGVAHAEPEPALPDQAKPIHVAPELAEPAHAEPEEAPSQDEQPAHVEPPPMAAEPVEQDLPEPPTIEPPAPEPKPAAADHPAPNATIEYVEVEPAEPEAQPFEAEPDEIAPPWSGPAALSGIPLEADLLGLANPVIITLLARLRDSATMELDASQSGLYRPQFFRPAPWSGFAYDQAADGRRGVAAGTRILTSRGELEVERLLPGDSAMTLRDPALLPITWIGRSVAAAPPVWIEAGALGPNLPRRGLCLAPDQPVYLEPVPVPAERLVNGSTIRRLEDAAVDMFHIDVGQAEILFAEGVPLSSSDRARVQAA